MTRTHFHGPGEADALEGLCLVCLMVARGAELDALAAEWEALERDRHDDRQKWFAWDGARTLIREAVVDGISDVLPQAGLIPLCWDHLGGLTMPKAASGLANGGKIPPGLLRGRG
jgi:hypothetical protein